MKLFIEPNPHQLSEDGQGGGGITRVVAAQGRWLPQYGIDVVDSESEADIVLLHGGSLIDTKKPIVANCHGLYWTGDFYWGSEFWQYNAFVIEVLRRGTKIIVPSEWIAQPIRRDMRKVPVIIHHGVDIEELAPQRDNDGFVLWGKPRVDVVCDPRVVNELAEKVPEVDFVTTFGRPAQNVRVIGSMPYHDFQGVMDRAMIWLATARETGDIGSREAMARGIPVLGWRHGATAELVKHMETGYLAELNNLDDLANGLRYCIENRKRLGEAARAEIEAHHQWKHLMAYYAKTLEAALTEETYDIDITVVIPTYNYAQYLSECLASIKAQTFDGRVEIIVVDDCSTDNTPEVLGGLSWPELKVLRHPENRGLCGSLNTGHERARGKYIVNLDADNLLPPNALKTLYEGMEAKPWIDLGSGGLMRYEKNGKHVIQMDWPWEKVDAMAQLNHLNQVPSTSIMRRRSFERLGGYRLRQRKNEDGEFWCRAISAGLRFERITKDPVLIYRWHGQNKSAIEGGEDNPNGPLAWNFYYPWRKHTDIMPFASTVYAPKGSWAVRSYERPHVAVVIPCGPGHQKYLVDALDSVYAQTFPNIECIVANDSGEPLDVATMGHPWVKVINTGGRKGPAIARNTAIYHAQAPLIVPLDADDLMYPDTIATFYQTWLQYPDSLVYADCEIEDGPTSSHPYESGPWSYEHIKRDAIYQVTTLFAKQWWEAIGGFPTDVPFGMWEDWLFGVLLHAAGIGATYVKMQWGRYRHWTAGEAGSKNAADNAGYGTPEFKEKVDVIHAWIAEKEQTMPCRGCGGERRTQVVNPLAKKAIAAEESEILVIYEGDRAGSFTINSRVFPGKKIRVSRDEPFTINAGDAHILSLPGIKQITLETPALPQFPQSPPEPPQIVMDTPLPPPTIVKNAEVQPVAKPIEVSVVKDDGLSILAQFKRVNADLLKQEGLDTLDKVKADLREGGKRLLTIKGIGGSTIAKMKEVLLA